METWEPSAEVIAGAVTQQTAVLLSDLLFKVMDILKNKPGGADRSVKTPQTSMQLRFKIT